MKFSRKVEILENFSSSEIVWLKFKPEFISLEGETVYLCLPYLEPVGSLWAAKQSTDFVEKFKSDVQRFSELCENRRVSSHQILTGRTDRSETALEIMNDYACQ